MLLTYNRYVYSTSKQHSDLLVAVAVVVVTVVVVVILFVVTANNSTNEKFDRLLRKIPSVWILTLSKQAYRYCKNFRVRMLRKLNALTTTYLLCSFSTILHWASTKSFLFKTFPACSSKSGVRERYHSLDCPTLPLILARRYSYSIRGTRVLFTHQRHWCFRRRKPLHQYWSAPPAGVLRWTVPNIMNTSDR